MNKMGKQKHILKKGFLWLWISMFLIIAVSPCYGQKVIKLSYPNLITYTSAVKKIVAIDGNFFTLINNQLIKFKVSNDSIVSTELKKNVKDFVQNQEKKNSLFLLTDNKILSLNTEDMSDSTHCNLVNVLEPEKLKSITQFEIDKNWLWLLKEFDFLEKIQLTEKGPILVKEKYTPRQKVIISIKFFNNLKLILTQHGIFKDGLKDSDLFYGDKSIIELSKRGFYVIATSDGDIRVTPSQEDYVLKNPHFQSNSENVRDVYHDIDNDLFWVAGNDLKVFSWDRKGDNGKPLLNLDSNSKPVFASVQAETICPIPGTTKVLVGTWGSGIFLIEYVKKDTPTPKEPTAGKEYTDTKQASNPPTESKSVVKPSLSVPFTSNIGTSQVPKPKAPIKPIEKKFVLDNFEKDSTILSPLDMLPFFNNIDEKIDFEQVEIKKVKIEGHASKTGEGSDSTKTKETSQKRIKFVHQKLTEKYKLSEGVFEEHNYGDTKPIDKKDLNSSKNRAVVVTFEYELKKK